MVLVIDNYDSFTYNLVQYVNEMVEVKVLRNDKFNFKLINNINPDHIIISPGPGRPEDAGESCNLIKKYKKKIPILGVCLGHQCIGSTFGARIIKADNIYHGKTSEIIIKIKNPLFKSINNKFTATRYHSLIIDSDTIPDNLEITALTKKNEIMGIKHRKYPIYGVQFHPESILTETGKKIIKNFINL
ncbi:MAG: anthranilate synthase component II [Bacillota bacterium]